MFHPCDILRVFKFAHLVDSLILLFQKFTGPDVTEPSVLLPRYGAFVDHVQWPDPPVIMPDSDGNNAKRKALSAGKSTDAEKMNPAEEQETPEKFTHQLGDREKKTLEVRKEDRANQAPDVQDEKQDHATNKKTKKTAKRKAVEFKGLPKQEGVMDGGKPFERLQHTIVSLGSHVLPPEVKRPIYRPIAKFLHGFAELEKDLDSSPFVRGLAADRREVSIFDGRASSPFPRPSVHPHDRIHAMPDYSQKEFVSLL